MFFNYTILYLAPPSTINTLEDFDDWLETLITHEYTHIVHLDKVSGLPEDLRSIFGRFQFLFPNIFQPAWVTEGLATYKETDFERGIGRGQSTMFASMMRAEVAKGIQPISHVNLPVRTWPAGTTRYLYGVYFMLFLSETRGEEKLHQWIEEYSDNVLPFFINTNASKVYDKDLSELWDEFRVWLELRFEPQLEEIRRHRVQEGAVITSDGYRTGPVQAIGDEVYYISNSGYREAALVKINSDGEKKVLAEVNRGASIDVHTENGLMLTQSEFCNEYTTYNDIYFYDENEEELVRKTECARYLYTSWHPDGKQIFAVHHNAGKLQLHRLDGDAVFEEILWSGEDGEILTKIDVSPDGSKIVSTMWQKNKGWNLAIFDLGDRHWQIVTSGSEIEAFAQFTPEGDILFSRENRGVYNLHRYTPGDDLSAQITNVTGGAFHPSQGGIDAPIYYVGYSAEGTDIYRLDEPELVTAQYLKSDSLLATNEFSLSNHDEYEYMAWPSVRPRWWFPSFQLSDQRSEFGINTAGSDALGLHNYFLSASYDTKLDSHAGSAGYFYADRLGFTLSRSNNVFVDDVGVLVRLSATEQASAVLSFSDTYFQHQSNLLFATIYDREFDTEVAIGVVPRNDFSDHILGIAWLYNTSMVNPLSISRNDGFNLRLVAEDSDALNSDFTGQAYTLDWKQYIRTGKESVLAWRFVQAWGTDFPSAFRLGGEGENAEVVNIILGNQGEAVFNRREYALRGYAEGHAQLIGRRMQLLSTEWRFPIDRPESGFMAPPVGLMQWSGSVFAETGSAYLELPQIYYASAGFELNADVNVFYGLNLRMRLGYAHGFDEVIGDDRVYLSIGSSF